MHIQHRMLRVFRLITMLRQRPARTIRNIAISLGISERSAYRYLDLVEELGFHVQTDSYRRLYIDDNINEALTFTQEEAMLMRDLLQNILIIVVYQTPALQKYTRPFEVW